VVKEATTFNGGVESRIVHDNIRRRIKGQWEVGLLVFLIIFLKNRGEAC
jgi:hypothetical protein